MNKPAVFIALVSLLIIIGLSYLWYTFSIGFVAGFDGNNSNSNYILLSQDYYLFKSENSICRKVDNSYSKITNHIDSLNWNEEVIVCFTREKYLKIDIHIGDTSSYSSRVEFLKSIKALPIQNLREIPEIEHY